MRGIFSAGAVAAFAIGHAAAEILYAGVNSGTREEQTTFDIN
jgi:hypothetical protein